MNGNTKFKIIGITATLLLAAILSSINRINNFTPRELTAQVEGIPIIIKQNQPFIYSGINQIASDRNHLYIVFSNGIVQAYDLNGNYLYSISVYSHQNGRRRVAVKDETLYICDKKNNLYIFQDDKLIKFLEKSVASDIINAIDFNVNTPHYEVRLSSIWHIPADGNAYCLIQRPFWLFLYQNGTSTIILFMLMLFIVCILFYKTTHRQK